MMGIIEPETPWTVLLSEPYISKRLCKPLFSSVCFVIYEIDAPVSTKAGSVNLFRFTIIIFLSKGEELIDVI